MTDRNVGDREAAGIIERIVSHGADAVGAGSSVDEAFLRCYFAHVGGDDLLDRRVEDLFGRAAEHAQLGMEWEPGSTSIALRNPRIDVDGWESDHTIVMLVTDDLPFLVDSVTMELSRLELGIHLAIHPILLDLRSEGESFADPRNHDDNKKGQASFISIEVDRQADPQRMEEIEQNLRRVLGDVRAAVADWPAMQQRMRDIAAGLPDENLPVSSAEVEEAQELLTWFAEQNFVFLGYREYSLADDRLTADPASGLGILSAKNGASPSGRPLSEMAPEVQARATARVLLNITKATAKSTIHRAAHLDYVGVKTFDEAGNVNGERRFLGLYTIEAYSQSVTRVPRLRRLAKDVIERAGYPPGGHDEKALRAILEAYPRDELFQIETDDLFEIAMGIAALQERRRVRVFARPELFGRFVTVMVYMPRDRYNTVARTGIQELLLEAYGGSSADWTTSISQSVLSRTLFHLRVDSGYVAVVDVPALEARIEELLRDWRDEFLVEAVSEEGEDCGVGLGRTYGYAFPLDYQSAFSPRSAIADVLHMEALGDNGDLSLNVYREPGQPRSTFKLKLYRRGERVSLTSVMPTLSNLGVVVLDERPYEIEPDGQEPIWIYDFSLECPYLHLDFAEVAELMEQTFSAVWRGEVSNDGLNRLVLSAGMGPREVGILRAYARYLHQAKLGYTRRFVENTFVEHAEAARLLVALFGARFDPERDDRDAEVESITTELFERVEEVTSLDQDRLLRRFHNLIDSTLRTNCFQLIDGDESRALPYLAFKFDPKSIDDLPEPRPQYEIFVYSPRFEGVHLRSGTVARGGLRWSDRLEDYRTEVLGLVKAQMVKNAVIVPSGAKGGFVLKRPPTDGDPLSLREEVVVCYKLFVSALLDITDNLVAGEVVPPAHTVRYDGDDTYLVVAADKGTATFSDIANELAIDRGMWLGDAFASGGSQGYDHKAMGITARGGWESVKRHFRALGRKIQVEPFTAVGIGDMSGDVFGNAMLLSEQTRLIAAFDHRNVFIDPEPDPALSHAERARLFALPRSSWEDYDTALISEGGGVYSRSAKSIDLSEPARAALGIHSESLTPDELILGILKAPVELLWNGGIGTYVKASDETHAEVGDKANDAIRVDGCDLRVLVVGEGGNLGVTQRGRIEFAMGGGYIFTDAIDNAGGVDCSDHEVNIKILLDQVTAAGDLTEKQRNELLADMTDEVGELVLANNYNQTQALSTARSEAASMVEVHARYLHELESRGLLDRALERLPDTEELTDRRNAGGGLSAPELAVLLAYTKIILDGELLASKVPDDDVFVSLLMKYFPTALQERYPEQIRSHRLRREIIANRISNVVVDRGGTSMVYRLTQETSAPSADVAAAHMAAWEIFQLDDLSRAVNECEAILWAERLTAIHLSGRQLAERATRLLVRSRPFPFCAASAIDDLAEPVQETLARLPEYLAGSDRLAYGLARREMVDEGLPDDLASRVASLAPALAALDIAGVASVSGAALSTVAAVHFAIADQLELNWLRDRILELPRDNQWSSLARLTLRGDLYTDHRVLTSQVIGGEADADPKELVSRWLERHHTPLVYYRHTIADIRAVGGADLTTLLVAAREVRNLIAHTS